MKRWTRAAGVWIALALVLAGAGCNTVTTLTASRLPRNKDGLYRVEAAWTSDASPAIDSSIKAYILADGELIPMERVPLVTDRWEGFLPVSADQSIKRYRFKFDYLYAAFPNPKPNSVLSPEHELKIVDRQ